VFPDHDFADVSPTHFIYHSNLRVVVDTIDERLGPICTPALLKRLWEVVDTEIGIAECLVFSYAADPLSEIQKSNRLKSESNYDMQSQSRSETAIMTQLDEVDDPFWDDGCM
jgi:hypothetical protein